MEIQGSAKREHELRFTLRAQLAPLEAYGEARL
jgi:hypothetical protein